MEQRNPNPHKLNIYICDQCGQHIVTRDVDEGTTPFLISCQCTHRCQGKMASSFYRVFDPEGRMRHTHEWYRPSVLARGEMSPATLHHVKQGGLLLRLCAGNPATHNMNPYTFTHRHKKRGGKYRIVGDVRLQISKTPINKVFDGGETTPVHLIQDLDGVEFTLYQGEDGGYSARHPDEFNDGRFEVLP